MELTSGGAPPGPGELAAYYDARYEAGYMEGYPRLEWERVRDLLESVPGSVGRVLDYGCGQGSWTPLLRRTLPRAQIFGVDVSEAAIAKARERFPDASFQAFDGERAPFDDGSMDLVFSYHVLEHVLDLEATLADMARLVRPGGAICTILPCAHAGSLEARLVDAVRDGRDPTTGRFHFDDPGHLRRPTSAHLVAPLAQQGASLTRAWYAGHRWSALEWLALDRAFPARALDPRRATSAASRARLLAWRAVLPIFGATLRAYRRSRVWRRIATARGARERLKWTAGALAKAAAAPVGAAFDAMARREWRARRADPRGSAQYLLFARSRNPARPRESIGREPN